MRTLENAPLIESVFELHWKLRQDSGTTDLQVPAGGLALQSDPNYRLAFARLSDKLASGLCGFLCHIMVYGKSRRRHLASPSYSNI